MLVSIAGRWFIFPSEESVMDFIQEAQCPDSVITPLLDGDDEVESFSLYARGVRIEVML